MNVKFIFGEDYFFLSFLKGLLRVMVLEEFFYYNGVFFFKWVNI